MYDIVTMEPADPVVQLAYNGLCSPEQSKAE